MNRLSSGDLVLAVYESFYIGGQLQEGTSPLFGAVRRQVGAMYVQHLRPAESRGLPPVVFVHGGMHTGVTWETTPDGREGWQLLFTRAGFETYVIDQAWRGRSAPGLEALEPGVAQAAPEVASAGVELAAHFARGGGRFPLSHLGSYGGQLWPDFGVPSAIASGLPARSDARALEPLVELIDRIGPVVLVTHSQGAHLGWEATLARPESIAAIATIEPGVTCPGLDHHSFPDIPVYVMWGDNLPDEGRSLTQRDLAMARRLSAQNTRIQVDFLPEHGITGNGHMLMMEDNSAELAQRVMDWFDEVL